MSEHDPLVRLQHMRDFARSALEISRGGSRGLMDRNETFAFALIERLQAGEEPCR